MRRGPTIFALLLGSAVLFLLPSVASAMHISEGILPPGWAALWYIVAAPFLWWGVRDVRARTAKDPKFKILVAMVGAAVFIISCMPIPVPTAGTCSHPCGTGLGAIIIGPGPTIVVSSVALLLQALFLAHGGLTTLGADVVSMGIGGALSGYFVFVLLRRLRLNYFACAFAAGLISDWVTYTITAGALAAGLRGDGDFMHMFIAIVIAFVPTQLPLGILEGFLSAGAYRFVKSRRPELLQLEKASAL
ncbi:MAG: energy-coupling factor ABC transporter permease [Lentisphaerae bacterium]|nr:energy-coupling factor ABC transporter permease [Lentisphaerota bacterium]